jgi:hypothetical protein
LPSPLSYTPLYTYSMFEAKFKEQAPIPK